MVVQVLLRDFMGGGRGYGSLFGYYGLAGPVGIRPLSLFFLIWPTSFYSSALFIASDY
jgi:hypothetical protein